MTAAVAGSAPVLSARGLRKTYGDRVVLDVPAGRLDLDVEPAELERRRADWKPMTPRYTSGVLAKYARLVGSAANGAVCD